MSSERVFMLLILLYYLFILLYYFLFLVLLSLTKLHGEGRRSAA